MIVIASPNQINSLSANLAEETCLLNETAFAINAETDVAGRKLVFHGDIHASDSGSTAEAITGASASAYMTEAGLIDANAARGITLAGAGNPVFNAGSVTRNRHFHLDAA